MDDGSLPGYDDVDQGLDQDRDRRSPATIERALRRYDGSAKHEAFVQRLSSGSVEDAVGQVLLGRGRTTSADERPLRCVIYVRVSTEEQASVGGEAEGYSIPYQRDACLALAKARGWEVVDIYVDAGESALSVNRPELQRMFRELKAKHVDYVVVHKIDRWSRNRDDDVEINKRIAYAGASSSQ
ncbi:recombinase family protein [Kribbella swartbergensis]